MDPAFQRYMLQMMSGKNTSAVAPVSLNVFKNTAFDLNQFNSYIKSNYSSPSSAQNPNGNIDGSSPIEGTNFNLSV